MVRAVSQYEAINSVHDTWAEANGLSWCREYQDTEVRTFYLGSPRRDRVQVAVDVPEGERTIVRVGQNRRALSRLARLADFPTPVADLPEALNRAWETAKEWIAEDEPA
jgi:hypothetical protein